MTIAHLVYIEFFITQTVSWRTDDIDTCDRNFGWQLCFWFYCGNVDWLSRMFRSC